MMTTALSKSDEASSDLELSHFDIVYNAAKEKNIAKIEVEEVLFIVDVRDDKALLTPAGKLAQEGDEESALWLLENGANVHIIGMGAAMGGYYKFAEFLYHRYGASADFIAKGAAIRGDMDYAMTLHEEKGASIAMIAEGAAMAGNRGAAEAIRLSYPDKHPHASVYHPIAVLPSEKRMSYNITTCIARGAILFGDQDYVEELLQTGLVNCNELILAAAIINNEAYVENLKRRYLVDNNYIEVGRILGGHAIPQRSLLDQILSNKEFIYLNMGLKGDVKALLLKFKNEKLDNAHWLHGLIVAGNGKFIEEFFAEANKHYTWQLAKAAMRVMCTGDLNYYGDLRYHAYLHEKPSYVFVSVRKDSILKDARTQLLLNAANQTPEAMLHRLSFIDNEAFVKELALSDEPHMAVIKQCANKAIKINQLRRKYDIDFKQAKAFLEQHELRAFILTSICSMDFNNTIPVELSIMMSTYLSPLSYFETSDLCDKVSVYFNKHFLNRDLETYKACWWIDHRDRATSFSAAANVANNKHSLIALIKYQKDLFDGVVTPEKNDTKPKHEQPLTGKEKDDFYVIIDRHNHRIR